VPDDFRATTLIDLDVRARSGVNILAIERIGGTTPNPAPTFEIEAGDRLLVLGDTRALSKLGELLTERSA
jgi:K+/H+ antiporter YhaU regulatory subunit KhtT